MDPETAVSNAVTVQLALKVIALTLDLTAYLFPKQCDVNGWFSLNKKKYLMNTYIRYQKNESYYLCCISYVNIFYV